MNETFATREPLTVSVVVPAGTVEIEAADTAETSVEVERIDHPLNPSEIEVRLRDDAGGQTLEVRTGRRRFRGVKYRVVIRTHTGADLRVETGSADVRADGVFGSARVHSGSGDISVGELRGAARLRTASGNVTLSNARGEVEIDCASGRVVLGTTHARAAIHSVAGDIGVDEALADLTVRTVSGDVRVDSTARGEISMISVSGDIDVGILPGAKAFIDVHSVAGDMRSDLAMTDAPEGHGDLDIELRAKTVSGDVVIRRAARQAA